MDQATVFTKTAKGITQVNQRAASLSKDLMKVLKMIDGKSNFGQIMEKAELDKNQLEKALNTLTKDGFARIFQTKKEDIDPFGDDDAVGGGGGGGGGGGDDFDFTAPGKMASATQRVVAGAANDISALAAQHAKQEADRKVKEAAHTAAAARAKAEAQVRAKLETEARARQEAERQAMEQAQRAKEAADRARAEVESQKREEEARQKILAAQQAKLSVEQKAKEEAESRRLAELRVKAEREAKALAEARARADAEAAAMAKARAEADAAAKKQAAEASQAQAEMKERLKEEIEARIRNEMEELLRSQAEEKEEKSEQSRAEMKAQILAEAKMAAQAELEERLREEREVIAKAESEARSKAEVEASARADVESKKRAEAEARAKTETEARIRAEEETKRLRAQLEQDSKRSAEAAAQAAAAATAKARQEGEEEAKKLRAQVEAETKRAADAAARARLEAEARAREAADVEKRLDAERQAKYEAEARAKIEAEESEKRQRELSGQVEAANKAKLEAEARAKIEAKARETIEVDTRAKVQAEIETDLTKKAEIEGKAQARAFMEAKAKAELDEDQKVRDEQARRAREIADTLRTRVEADDVAPESAASPKRRAQRRGSIVKPAIVGLVLLVIVVIGGLHVIPLRAYTAKIEKSMSEWLQDDVAIGSMTFRLVPSPHLRVENFTVGKSLDAKAALGRVDLDLFSLFGDKPNIRSIELDNITLTPEAVRRIPRWGRTEGKGAAGSIDRIQLRGVKLETKPPLDPFNATLNFARDGALKQAQLVASSGWSLNLRPAEKGGFEFDATARNLTLPMGAAILVADARFKGTYSGNEILVPEFEADAMEGKVNGTLRLNWDRALKLESDLSLAGVNSSLLMGAFTKAISVTGKLEGNFNFATEGPTLEGLFAAPRAQGKFRIGEGTISNVDLVAVMQSDSAGSRAGVTKFAELTGELASADHRSQFRTVTLQGGVLRGNGNVEVGSAGNLNGRLQLEIRSQVAQDRGAFSISGTVSRPIIKRGG